MPITIHPAPHAATIRSSTSSFCTSESALLQSACRKEHALCKEILQSSFSFSPKTPVYPSGNGFVHAAVQAYNRHHHLIIRPEDVWVAILTQLSLYINKHAEELRGKFVAFEGKRELEVKYGGNRYTVDFADFALKISHLLEENVVDKELREWMMPAFTTTTQNDMVIASIVMMGSMQKYFDFKCTMMCGLPSVTLLGEKADWEIMLARLEKLQTFGEETTQWYQLLRPVLSRFVATFDQPESVETLGFWNRIVHSRGMGSGPRYYSGWLTAFCFWDHNGDSLYRMPKDTTTRVIHELTSLTLEEKAEKAAWEKSYDGLLCLDGTLYHILDSSDVPPGYISVPVRMDDNGYKFMAMMVAGSVGIKGSSSGKLAADGKIGIDTLQSEAGWWMFHKEEQPGEMEWAH